MRNKMRQMSGGGPAWWLVDTHLSRPTLPVISHFNGLPEALSFQLSRGRYLFSYYAGRGSDADSAFSAGAPPLEPAVPALPPSRLTTVKTCSGGLKTPFKEEHAESSIFTYVLHFEKSSPSTPPPRRLVTWC
ncbi:hypothetical protein E2C01_071017 [Portunus trituberculatus]|uniref:Uncharacterized protein n=1 Tax=Portunus trituberculatus TaxID=210409 RepID=A0A5B7HVT4_PORTR|nr:hypothetical protein [Portunus trituberculatus]